MSVSTNPRAANPAPIRNAWLKPLVSATLTVWTAPERRSSFVVLLAIDARIARPSAPPICCEVLISPEARPASPGVVPLTAAIVTGTNDRPRPIPARIDGNRTSPT